MEEEEEEVPHLRGEKEVKTSRCSPQDEENKQHNGSQETHTQMHNHP